MALRVLQQEPTRARADRSERVLVEIERGQNEHLGLRVVADDRLGGGDAVQLRHPDVHEHQVGGEQGGLRDRRLAVAGLTDHHDVFLRVEHHPEPDSDELLVIHQQHRDRIRHPSSSIVSRRAAGVRPEVGSTARRTHRPPSAGADRTIP